MSASGSGSALHDNIARNGETSYYYAHGKTSKERLVTSLGDEPRCLGAISTVATEKKKNLLTSYQWADENGEVTVFIPIQLDVPPDISVESGEREVRVEVKAEGTEYCFILTRLYEKIASASAKWGPKNKRVVLKMVKAVPGAWWKLLESDRPYSASEED